MLYLVRLLKRHQSRKLEKYKRRRNHREWFGVSRMPGISPSFSESRGNDLAVMVRSQRPESVPPVCVCYSARLYFGLSAYFITMFAAPDHGELSPAGSPAHVSGRRKRKYTSGGFPQATISSVSHITHSCFPLLAVIIHYPLSFASLL